jgi:hypothetical protein
MEMKSIRFQGYELSLKLVNYSDGSLAIIVVDEQGQRLFNLSVNMPDYPIAPNHIFLKNWSENAEIYEHVMTLGIFELVKTVPSGFVQVPLVRILEEI